ncbi:uncharacterized protein LOC120194567 [Hibiscus syriacus]|uniref:uncharacterized protein LOC120194567 n=1 Tax=Hibiscus syriacus TaxID=106335 RepID=UPI001922CEC6|nr:uncharacterized protein LOC120194567 [Hibiscus syriacus]
MELPEGFRMWIGTCVTASKFYVAFNGILVGFFNGQRGLRQRDPLSPYLFVLVINVISHLLDVASREGIFKYHPKCKRISLTHLCFADDLLIFCYGSMDFVFGVKSVLEVFYGMSGLKLNAVKTELFACGMDGRTLEKICDAIDFRLGKILVRYLGVPLVTRKLTEKDCLPLVENIRGKLVVWQLILPKDIIRKIEQLCMRFFWMGNDSSPRSARISWSQIYSSDRGSLWVAWINEYVLMGHNFLYVVSRPHYSWILMNLFLMGGIVASLFGGGIDWNKKIDLRESQVEDVISQTSGQ